MAVARSNSTYLAARYRRIVARRGPARALVATQRAMLTAMWHMAHTGEVYHELGTDHFVRQRRTYIKNRHPTTRNTRLRRHPHRTPTSQLRAP